ncbi:hypothetical protein PRZ48_006960 [Zasmidium cellare]|uniref:AIG1-type G domain-containing protein n=1 Tax=Zasmidium cellare TaxID=395010 RepID=A0ABR0EI12_ZASCE|nr:hypothetical protein PRZ48_006960 [Zasmidium cellare]
MEQVPAGKMQHYSILVLGASGAGKSEFIRQCAGDGAATTTVQEWSFELDERCMIHLIDTPGIGNPEQDFEVVPLITNRLVERYRWGHSLAAVLFFYSAADNSLSDDSRRALEILKKICGEECFQEVILVATQSGKLDGDEGELFSQGNVGAERLAEMAELLQAGAQTVRYAGSKELAITIIRSCILDPRNIKLRVQRELVDQKKEFARTMAGRQLKADMLEMQEVLMQDRLRLRTDEVDVTALQDRKSAETVDRKLQEVERACGRIGHGLRILRGASSGESVYQARDALSEAIATGSLNFLQMALERHFATVATGAWEWLTELEQLGHGKNEIAELLLEQKADKPWITFDPRIIYDRLPERRFHIQGCVHSEDSDRPTAPLGVSLSAIGAARQLRLRVASLCGLGGVVPSSQESSSWKTLVRFPDDSSAEIDHQNLVLDVSLLARHLATAMRRLCTALAVVQENKACCDRFTVLVEELQLSAITLRAIRISDIMNFSAALQRVDKGHFAALPECQQTARKLLDHPALIYASAAKHDTLGALHECSLAVQFLSLGLVSYCQAHTAKFDFFFLEQRLQCIRLLGSGSRTTSAATISVVPRCFACLDDMTRGPVIVFAPTSSAAQYIPQRLDLIATPEGLLDTWGPGEMVKAPGANTQHVRALTVQGGIILRITEHRFHWQHLENGTIPTLGDTFSMYEPVRVGADLDVNLTCTRHENSWLQLCRYNVRPLGTSATRMRQKGLEYGVQAGQFGMATFNPVMEKVPGNSLKKVMLERLRIGYDYASFLEAPCGLQVSFCSGLARRVRMRDLLAELLPKYVERKLPRSSYWSVLQDQYSIVQVLLSSLAKTVTDQLQRMYISDPVCFDYFWTLTFELVSSIRDTGLDVADFSFAVAIIPSAAEEPLTRAVFNASGPNYWMRALRDTDTCATFAYFTLSCLQSPIGLVYQMQMLTLASWWMWCARNLMSIQG